MNGETVLYMGEVSTIDCLERLPQADPVRILEFGATWPGGTWIDRLELSTDAVVENVVAKLKECPQEVAIVNFVARVGSVTLSTHDDGEADVRFGAQEDALAFLRKALPLVLSAELIPQLLKNLGRYVAKRQGLWKAFETFDAYLASEFTGRRQR
ncbi:MAG TPA: hypothetical protein VF911_17065 [Thermoanaerobaculia bacterium]